MNSQDDKKERELAILSLALPPEPANRSYPISTQEMIDCLRSNNFRLERKKLAERLGIPTIDYGD